MTAIVPFDSGSLPAHIRRSSAPNKMASAASAAGFPVISIKGKVFHIVRGGERTLITKPGEDDPAASLEVVVLDLNAVNSKVFYANGYQEGNDSKPTCYSNNGKHPEADSSEPQAKLCASCVHNQWGSRITADGKKGKSCADSRRMAIATPDAPADPMLVRVPAASLKAMGEYGKILSTRGLEPHHVITKIGFDYSVAHPALTFKPVGIINDGEMMAGIEAARKADIVAQITGEAPTPAAEAPVEEAAPAIAAPAPTPAPAPAPAKAAKPAATKADAVEAAVATAATTKKADVKVEKKPGGLEDEISGMIEGMDFDD
jgi:hypothetical protein